VDRAEFLIVAFQEIAQQPVLAEFQAAQFDLKIDCLEGVGNVFAGVFPALIVRGPAPQLVFELSANHSQRMAHQHGEVLIDAAGPGIESPKGGIDDRQKVLKGGGRVRQSEQSVDKAPQMVVGDGGRRTEGRITAGSRIPPKAQAAGVAGQVERSQHLPLGVVDGNAAVEVVI